MLQNSYFILFICTFSGCARMKKLQIVIKISQSVSTLYVYNVYKKGGIMQNVIGIQDG